jgi:hypothetical protein
LYPQAVGAGIDYLMQFLMAGIAQKAIYTLRQEVEEEFDLLPL